MAGNRQSTDSHTLKRGICQLCLRENQLRDSHFIPKSIYRRIRSGGGPIVMTPQVILGTDRQVHAHVFCGNCETRLSDGGERYMASVVFQGPGKPFPFLEQVRTLRWLERNPLTFSGSQAGIDTEKLAYFALSMLFRAAVRKWDTLDGQQTSVNVTPEHTETMRRYLLGETAFPDAVVVVVTACLDLASQYLTFSPTSTHDGDERFQMSFLGVYLRVILGVAADDPLRTICCIHSREKRVHVENCMSYSLESFGSIHEKARIAKNVEGTPYAKRPKGLKDQT
jgi:hypothetical protein